MVVKICLGLRSILFIPLCPIICIMPTSMCFSHLGYKEAIHMEKEWCFLYPKDESHAPVTLFMKTLGKSDRAHPK